MSSKIRKSFIPDYTIIEQAAFNMNTKRIPLYEHIISTEVMERILGSAFSDLINGNNPTKKSFSCNTFNFIGKWDMKQ
jgi:hypothetical protein